MSIATKITSQFIRGTTNIIKHKTGLNPNTPYMKCREIDILLEAFKNLQPKNCLEWGSGYSTLYFPQRLNSNTDWHAIEHDKDWAEMLKSKINRGNTYVHFLPPNHLDAKPFEVSHNFEQYIHYPIAHQPYDFILVDGMVRNDCIQKSKELLSEDGLIVVHDCNRKEYHDYLKTYPYFFILEDFRRTAGGIGFASKTKPISEYIDLDSHIKSWKIQSSISQFLKFKWLISKPSPR